MDGDGDMVMTNTEQTFPPAEAGNHLRLLLGQIEDVLHQPCLLIFHLHDEFDPAAVQKDVYKRQPTGEDSAAPEAVIPSKLRLSMVSSCSV